MGTRKRAGNHHFYQSAGVGIGDPEFAAECLSASSHANDPDAGSAIAHFPKFFVGDGVRWVRAAATIIVEAKAHISQAASGAVEYLLLNQVTGDKIVVKVDPTDSVRKRVANSQRARFVLSPRLLQNSPDGKDPRRLLSSAGWVLA